MSGRGVGGMGAGCAGFSLIGLLVGVGLTVWLGTKVLDATRPTRPAPTPTTEVATQASVTIEPESDLADGQTITVSAAGLEPGPVRITPCLIDDVEPARCDASSTVEAMVSDDGVVSSAYTVTSTIVAGGAPVACADPATPCRLLVHPPDLFDGPSAPLRFQPG